MNTLVKKSRGFTLIEVLISLTLLSMIMVAVVAAMRTFGNTRATLEQVTQRVDEMRVVSEFLRRTIGGALPVVRVGGAEGDQALAGSSGDTYFAGDSSQMVWVAPIVAGADMGGAYVMQLSRSNNRLQLNWRPYERDFSQFEEADLEPRSLIEAVDEFRIGYLATYGGDWLDEWPGQRFNPVAVRLNIRSGDRYWPELVIRLNGAPLNAL